MKQFRSGTCQRTAMCSVHPGEPATLQCLQCLRSKVRASKSFHCTSQCLMASWPEHKELHLNPASGAPPTPDDELEAQFAFTSYRGNHATQDSWVLVGRTRSYTPIADDIGHTLKYEVVAVDSESGQELETPTVVQLAGRVFPLPAAPLRTLLPVEGSTSREHPSNFTVMTYNVLADLYATNKMFPNCPQWALAWSYRRQSLVREIVCHQPDIVCLQEVQSDHYEEFYQAEMLKAGYTGVYKTKTAAMYEVEFNKAAMSLSEALSAANQKKAALNRLLKDNVALIVVLSSLVMPELEDSGASRQLVCVANTHIHANPELKDVKLWQVHTLLKGLEKIAASADIPMIVTGDFNSTPGSAPHSLLANGRVDASHPELATDPLGILRPPSKLCHQLPLKSAYASMVNPGLAGGPEVAEPHARRLEEDTHEPLFTNFGENFTGTLDYIFYTANSLVPTELLELPEKEDVTVNGHGMPNSRWPSDHISLMAEFAFKAP